MSSFSIYLHIPFCSYKCPYCDFNTYAVTKAPEEEYINSLLLELEESLSNKIWKDREVETIYWGGGTPSLLSANAISKVYEKIKSLNKLNKNIEVTLEANPEEISLEKLVSYKQVGVNRISFGSQSLNNKVLKTLGRKHSKNDIINAVENSRNAGIENINLDLIFAVPNQTIEELENDLNEYLKIKPNHISTYELTIEKGTPFYSSYKKNILKPISEDKNIEMYKFIRNSLIENGYEHYELSNFSLKNYQSLHNSNYWKHKDYLGVGAGAHSFYKNNTSGIRYVNYSLPKEYNKKIRQFKTAISTSEELSKSSYIFEKIMLGLRTSNGFCLDESKDLLTKEKYNKYHKIFEDFKLKGLIKEENCYCLTQKGQEIADSIFEKFAA